LCILLFLFKIVNVFADNFLSNLYVYRELVDCQDYLLMILVRKFIVTFFCLIQIKTNWSVSKKIDKIIFTNNGWYAVHDFYHIQFWVWVKLVYLCSNMFQININDRFNNEIVYPTQNPPMKFIIQKNLYFNINFFPWSIICYHFQSYFKGCVKDIANQC
jgi:hypothetical protein